ncbi:DNA mismatch repair protein MutS [Roseomonas sp. NAR14]|uniref:DNA mismatch repair protein MutS n=1 Tax=Roseomonas acroporae TaxID=2937791 RepID=A0A9X1Y9J1_9PROT|nr:DNA mismatch repair protein MutS [Roseomonas acroporae]MCK8785453.1 DNA mismatch repair protein MutS [Roseomonas acroporae]
MAQWFAAKARHPDALLFFRMGDFYEMFFGDAEAAAAALGLLLSHRGEHRGAPVPMCGVPAHSHEGYLARLIRQGFRVAICEQMETPEEAKRRRATAVRREVVRLVTPATVTEDALLEAGRPAWLLALAPAAPVAEGAAPDEAAALGAAWLDVSTGAFETEATTLAELPALLARLEPAEVLAPAGLRDAPALRPVCGRLVEVPPPRDPARRVAAQFAVATLDGFGRFAAAEIAAAAMALDYLGASQGSGPDAAGLPGAAPTLSPPCPRGGQGVLQMDAATRRSLEITRPLGAESTEAGGHAGAPLSGALGGPLGGRRANGTLLGAVDCTVTAAGGRELASRLACPLAELAPVAARHDAVAWLLAAGPLRAAVRETLRGTPDLARALGRLSFDRFAPRDLAAVRDGLARAGRIAGALAACPALPPLLHEAVVALRPEPSPEAELACALAENLPARLEEGGVVAAGYDGELDALRRLRDGAREAIAALQLDLAQAWGVAALKIRHHQQFGFLAELPSAAGERLLREAPRGLRPEHAPVHRQTMANAHRFTCPALAELDRRVAEAGEQAGKRERRVVAHLRQRCLDAAAGLRAAAAALAEIDVHAAAAELAAGAGWCRPELTERPEFRIRGGRHPAVEAALAMARGPAFVPNDCDLSPGRRLCLLTGPNMAGKSTYLRQNAHLAILAQAGLFVPAASARIGIVDRLFSRVGASDDLAGGRSTFMVEMTETAAILNQATPRSLVVLDEVGRGTATWDGLAIAWAVLEALHDRLRCRTVFATHFHELVSLAGKLPELRLATMRVREWRGEVVFLHSIGEGAAERSWGLHVARLAGVPRPVLARAEAVLHSLEGRARALAPLAEEMPLFARAGDGGVEAPGTARAGPPSVAGVEPAPPPATSGSTPAMPPRATPPPHPALAALAALDPDALTPRAAQDMLYRLRAMLDAAAQDAEGSQE